MSVDKTIKLIPRLEEYNGGWTYHGRWEIDKLETEEEGDQKGNVESLGVLLCTRRCRRRSLL